MKQNRAKNIKWLVEHVSAGFAPVERIEDWWRTPASQGGPGWMQSKGYNVIVDLKGVKYFLDDPRAKYGYTTEYNDGKCFEFICNGVRNFNQNGLQFCKIGGVENLGTPKNPIWKAKDTTTPEQEQSLQEVLLLALKWLIANGRDVTQDLSYVGHRDFSPDKDKSGVIESWERIKECPSRDVIGTLEHYLFSSPDRYGKLPYN